MTDENPTPEPNLAEEDRTRLMRLLNVEADSRLRPASGQVTALAGASWSTGFVDADAGIALAAYFIPDPAVRAPAASKASDAASESGAVRVTTNGALLLVASSASSDDRTLERVQEILSRFAGKE